MTNGRRKQNVLNAVRNLVPQASLEDFNAISEIALRGHLRHLPPTIAAWQAATTIARHRYSEYDQLLEEGYDPDAARHFVLEEINDALAKWGCLRRLGED